MFAVNYRFGRSARSSRRLLLVGIFSGVVLGFGMASLGCTFANTTTPRSTLNAFAAALETSRFRDAYNLLGVDYRRRVSYDEFRRLLESNPNEARELSSLLRHELEDAEVTASVVSPGGDTLRLVFEDGRWRILGNVVDFYDQSTPRAAVRSFVRAMERRRYDVVLRFVPEADREGMSVEKMREAWEGDEEIERLLAVLREHLEDPIEEVGDRATMPYADGRAVHLVREGELWRIEDAQ